MKHLILAVFALLPLCVFSQTKTEIANEVTITGQIENYDQTVVKLQDFMGKSTWINEIEVLDGRFSVNVPLDNPAIKMLTIGSTFKNIYLMPGETLKVSFDALNIDKTYSYEGSLAEENSILDSLTNKQRNINYNYLYTESLENSSRYLDSITSENKQLIEILIGDKKVASDFAAYAKALTEYKSAYLKITLGERQNEQPENYYDFIDQLSLENDKFLDILEYRVFLSEYIEMKSSQRLNQLDAAKISEKDALFDESLVVIKEFKNEKIRDYALYNALIMRLKEKGIADFEKYFSYFKEHNKDQHYAEQLEIIYEEKQLLAPGKPAPPFTLTDVNGNLVSLDAFKGKYVYIDFWQTLCPRSGKELPHLLNLHSDYKDENIAFVSISVNEDENIWRDYVKENKNFGTSLRVPKSWDSKTYKDYQVFGLPTFILIDPEGKIINPKAPKPSSKEIRDTFDQLLARK